MEGEPLRQVERDERRLGDVEARGLELALRRRPHGYDVVRVRELREPVRDVRVAEDEGCAVEGCGERCGGGGGGGGIGVVGVVERGRRRRRREFGKWVYDLWWYGRVDGVVQGDDVVAEGLAELEGALELGGAGRGRPGDVEVV